MAGDGVVSVRVARLGDVLEDLRSGFACGEDDPSGVIQFRMNNVERDGTLNWTKVRRVPSSMVKGGLTLRPNDILLNATNSPDLVGKTALFPTANEPVTFSNHFLRLRTAAKFAEPGYVARWLRRQFELGSFKAMCRSWVNQASVTRDQISNLQIPLPPLDEQKRIAAILDKADQLRQKRRQAIALLDSLTQSIFLEMFGDRIFAGSSGASLDQVAEIQIGPFGSLLHKEDYTDDGIPLVNPMHIVDGCIVPSRDTAVALTKYAELQRYRLDVGDVVLGRRGEMGRCAVVRESEEGYVCGTGSMFLRPNKAKLNSVFLAVLLRSRPVVRHLENASAGVTMPNLNKSVVSEIKVDLPPIHQQLKFANAINTVAATRESTAFSHNELVDLFASLQHRAFTGQL